MLSIIFSPSAPFFRVFARLGAPSFDGDRFLTDCKPGAEDIIPSALDRAIVVSVRIPLEVEVSILLR